LWPHITGISRGGTLLSTYRRQFAGLDNPELHAVTPLGTKHVIYDYYDEIELCMREVMRGYIDRREFLEVRCMSGERC
jgi:hypothetical protein